MGEDGIERDGYRAGDHVIITGAGGGFGRAFCQRFGRMGLKISAWDIDCAGGEDSVRMVRDAGGEAQFFAVDLADRAQIDAAISASLAAFGVPYAVVNNASIYPRASLIDMPVETFEQTLKINITAPMSILHALGPQMIAQKRGIIINIASGRGVEGAANGVGYACSKAAILSLTKTVALEWAKHNIRCNAIIPGMSMTAQPLAASTPEELIERGKKRVPLGRIGYPEDVAGLAAFLLSPDAAYMTGQGVAINGGNIMVP